MPDAPPTAALTDRPDPPQDRPAVSGRAPTRAGRLRNLVRKLIDYGKDLVTTLQQRTPATDLRDITGKFGTSNIALIVVYITGALHRAVALEARVIGWGARPDDRPTAPRARSQCKPRAPRPPAELAEAAASRLARVLTPEEIAAEIRCRPIALALADICRGLEMVPSDKLWQELAQAITEYGGSIGALFRDTLKRLHLGRALWPAIASRGWALPSPPLPAASGAGPPAPLAGGSAA